MTPNGWFQILLYMVVLIALAKPLGSFMASVYQGEKTFLSPLLRPVESFIYRICGANADEEMPWKTRSPSCCSACSASLPSSSCSACSGCCR